MNHYSTQVMWIGGALYLLAVLTTTATEMLPTFLEEPESTVISHHASVTLPCKVAPSDSVVRWKFNGELIERGHEKWETFSFIGTNLHIENFKRRRKEINHEGIYQCIAETSLGSVTSRPARLSRSVLRRFQSRHNLDFNVTEGHVAVLPCQPPESSPPANIFFEFNGTLLSGLSDRYSILSTGSLLINNVTMEDQGQYRCVAINPLTNQTRTADHVINLHVKKNSSSTPSQDPVIVSTTTTFQTKIGDNVTLECIATGNPQPTISWKRYGGKWPETRHKIINGNLFIWNTEHEDAGTYVCEADNGDKDEIKVKGFVLELLEQPHVKAETQFVTVNPGESVRLKCEVGGYPKLEVIWYHNALPITDILEDDNGATTLSINDIQTSDGGLYQCMCSNDIGVSYAVINVEVKGQLDIVSGDGNLTPNGQGSELSTLPTSNTGSGDTNSRVNKPGSAGRRRKGDKRRKNRRKNRRRNNKKKNRRPANDESASKVKLIPPTAPEVSQLSDTSVKLEWEVPQNDGLNIVFYRVQYKLIKPKKGQWKTEDVEIPGDRRVYEVSNLKPEATYKFRIAAVYSNNDNKAGPNSKKFMLERKPYTQPKVPEGRPTIVQVDPVEYQREYETLHALNVKWNYKMTKSPQIEGFFLYYKPYSSNQDYDLVQMTEPMARMYLLSDLEPNTEYSIKIQSFNSAGNSEFSNKVVRRTKGGKPVYPFPPKTAQEDGESDNKSPTANTPPTEVKESNKTNTQSSSEMLYMILGIVFGVMMLFLIIFMFMCWWKQRQQRNMMLSMNDAARSKFQDSAQRIYADSLRKKYAGMNGVNGTVANGHIPNSYTKMNISVNPLSDVESRAISNGHGGHLPDTYQHSTFIPNGSVPGHPSGSDKNFNKINRNMENSLQRGVDHTSDSIGTEDCLQSPDSLGGGEALACPPSPQSSNVPSCFEPFHTDSTGRYSNSNRSCDQLAGSHDHLGGDCESSLNGESAGGSNSGKHKRRRRRAQNREQSTRDQATNTDLSSNEGTIEFSTFSKTPSSSHISGSCSSPVSRTYVVDPSLQPDSHVNCQDV